MSILYPYYLPSLHKRLNQELTEQFNLGFLQAES